MTRRAASRWSNRDERGEALALLVLWPALLMAILVLLVHAFIITNAQAAAEVAASNGLRAAWRSAANHDFGSAVDQRGIYTGGPYEGDDPHPHVQEMAEAAQHAVARTAATEEGWRWWTPGVAEVQSDWCYNSAQRRPGRGDPGWVRVVVSGEVFGPLAALWPDRLNQVYAVAAGPAVITSAPLAEGGLSPVPIDLPTC